MEKLILEERVGYDGRTTYIPISFESKELAIIELDRLLDQYLLAYNEYRIKTITHAESRPIQKELLQLRQWLLAKPKEPLEYIQFGGKEISLFALCCVNSGQKIYNIYTLEEFWDSL